MRTPAPDDEEPVTSFPEMVQFTSVMVTVPPKLIPPPWAPLPVERLPEMVQLTAVSSAPEPALRMPAPKLALVLSRMETWISVSIATEDATPPPSPVAVQFWIAPWRMVTDAEGPRYRPAPVELAPFTRSSPSSSTPVTPLETPSTRLA